MSRNQECPNCATDIPETARICPICRYEFPRRPALPWKPVAFVLLLALLVPALLGVLRVLR
jgi:predicted amidophosphoribosyltransferase